ncbi:elongation factor tu GTP-binding domain-containing protein [Cyclospora cayetanensis]|uniref:Elongation factor tu GTP-binding domain-containing protein n=1 Tax=Cyclospora cayetanensis TaxID=88456 RepID=A0A1D3CW68_9EIME|nr:elongation factor tu GTP-binding domain-containing protein [Cyclospora cayetanensis]
MLDGQLAIEAVLPQSPLLVCRLAVLLQLFSCLRSSRVSLLCRCCGLQELRVFFRLPYSSVQLLCRVSRCPATKVLRWQDTRGLAFEASNKKKVMVDFYRAAHAARRFGLRAVRVDPEPEWQQEHQAQQAAVPVVALLGHINHGKTTLLDRLSATRIAPFEAGGITQQLLGVTVRYSPNSSSSSGRDSANSGRSGSGGISAAAEKEDGRLISFIDTPGHAAMSSMRARAAAAADVALVVIEADRGKQQQTAEAIRQADACKLPVVFALNKIDTLLLAKPCTDSSASDIREALLRLQAAEGRLEAETDPAALAPSAFSAAVEAERSPEDFALQQLLLIRMQLRRECQRMVENGEIERDLSEEAMRAVPISALYGHGIEDLIRRVLKVAEPLKLPLRIPASLCTTPGSATRYQLVTRRSDALVEAHLPPSGVGTILDIQQSKDRGLVYTVLLKVGALLPGNYFVAGSVYGRISSVWRYSCTFKGAPYTPEALKEDQGVPGVPFPVGSVLQVATQREKGGEAAIDDLILCLPQTRAYRLAVHRKRLEELQRQQIDGPLLELPWEVDHPKEAGSRWQQLQQRQIRRPVSEGRRAIEEFGFVDDDPSSSKEPLFTDATREEFTRPLRSVPFKERCAENSEQGAHASEAALGRSCGHRKEELLDEMELLGRSAKAQQQQLKSRCTVNLDPIIVTPEEDGYDEEEEEPTSSQEDLQNESINEGEVERGGNSADAVQRPLGRSSRRRQALRLQSQDSLSPGEAADNPGAGEGLAVESHPLHPNESRDEWAERVVKENEQLMGRWRAKSRQRKEAYAEQQRLMRAAAVEAEQQRRAALQEAPLTPEEMRRLIEGTEGDENEEGSYKEKSEQKTFPAPPKDAPVVPVILRTRYVGSFDMLLDELEKIETEMGMRIPVVHGGIGPIAPRDIVHAEVERTYGYCPVYAFQVSVLPDAIKQAVISKVIIKKFDVFTDLLQDVRERCNNIRKLQYHNLYVRSLKKHPTMSGL